MSDVIETFKEIYKEFSGLFFVFSVISFLKRWAEFMNYLIDINNFLPDQPILWCLSFIWFWLPDLIWNAIVSYILGWVTHKLKELINQ